MLLFIFGVRISDLGSQISGLRPPKVLFSTFWGGGDNLLNCPAPLPRGTGADLRSTACGCRRHSEYFFPNCRPRATQLCREECTPACSTCLDQFVFPIVYVKWGMTDMGHFPMLLSVHVCVLSVLVTCSRCAVFFFFSQRTPLVQVH